MSKANAELLFGLAPDQANRVVTLLLSQGIAARGELTDEGHSTTIYVAAEAYDAARRLLAEEYPYGLDYADDEGARESHDPFRDAKVQAPVSWFGRGSWAVLGLIGICVAMFAMTHLGGDAGSRSRMLEYGAISWGRVEEAGDYWRLAAAVFLHFDGAHLLANMGTFLLVGPPLAHTIGPWRFLFLFMATGVGANIISHELSPVMGLKAGASGAIAGVLGGLAGNALRPNPDSRFKGWQRLGALAAFYGMMIGFGPGRDNTAHVAGVVLGVLIGRFMPAEPMEPNLTRPAANEDSSA
jgi:rhomboid protease GluP